MRKNTKTIRRLGWVTVPIVVVAVALAILTTGVAKGQSENPLAGLSPAAVERILDADTETNPLAGHSPAAVEWARGRYHAAGLTLPAITVSFDLTRVA